MDECVAVAVTEAVAVAVAVAVPSLSAQFTYSRRLENVEALPALVSPGLARAQKHRFSLGKPRISIPRLSGGSPADSTT